MKSIGNHSNHSYINPSNYQVLGSYKGVEARRSLSTTDHFLFHEGFFTGYSFDDLEYIRRFIQKVHHLNFYNISNLKELWSLSKVERISDSVHFQVIQIENSDFQVPQVDDILIWITSDLNWHAGIVSFSQESILRVASQGIENWSESYSQEFLITGENCSSVGINDGKVLGWLRITQNEVEKSSGVRRVSFNSKKFDQIYNLDDPFELAFSKEALNLGEYRDVLQYYEWTEEYYDKVKTCSSELHHMVMEATAKVIESDELLGKFGINEVFWPYIRHSWSNHQLFLCGRFDLGFDGKSMKLLEYNADSAGLVAETSVIQNIWAEATGSAIGKSGGDSIHSILVESWKKLSQGRKVHIFVDHSELEEIYMEKYYGMVLKDAGIEFKDENRISEIRVTETGVIDKDGEIIQVIWKVWNWNTICRRFFEKGEDRKLADIMLHPSVTVVEPFWKIISSSKALLPVIWDLFGNHPLLLRAEFQLSDEMADGKYVSKPISGRLGENVNVFQNGKIVEGSEGSLAQVESVFQKFFQLPEFDDGFHAILGSWVIGEAGSGIIVREHQTLITGFYSPVISCRIVASQ